VQILERREGLEVSDDTRVQSPKGDKTTGQSTYPRSKRDNFPAIDSIRERLKTFISQDHINSDNIWWQDIFEVGCPIEESRQHSNRIAGRTVK
jgi:hypothetical protein